MDLTKVVLLVEMSVEKKAASMESERARKKENLEVASRAV
jgi:hypothetical protein